MRNVISVWSDRWNSAYLFLYYNRNKVKRIPIEKLRETQQELLKTYKSDQHKLEGMAFFKNNGTFMYNELILNVISSDAPKLLKDHQFRETDYVKYGYAGNLLSVQRNGFMVYCAPTGQGKTYFALSNIATLSKQCDNLLYINFELSIDDIYNRCYNMGIKIPDNLWIAPIDNVNYLKTWCEDKGKVIFIIDNIDNLVGGGLDPFGLQLNFIKDLDKFLKDDNHHALVLTQLVKDTNINLLDKVGYINHSLNTNVLSGVKQLSYLSRTVMMTAYSQLLNNGQGAYDYKILKLGSGKIE